MINIEFDDRAVLEALRNLQQHTGNLRPALLKIGEELTESTKKRFGTKTGPDGERWADNSPVTIERKGRNWPLTGGGGEHGAGGGALGDTIHDQLLGNDEVQIGSSLGYAAMQQFGGTKSEFPYLWGDIPARPFLGVSNDDHDNILEIIREYLNSAI